jgi:LmbE family N-acetylglucosaminyl deacetylase
VIAVVSPHLDDGVFACGELLAAHPGSVVITALAGGRGGALPPGGSRWEHVTPWDAACGFEPGDDVIAARRAEDLEALSILGAAHVWLDFPDAQYGPSPSPAALAEALDRVIEPLSPTRVFIPLGLFHSDHVLVSNAALGLVRARRAHAFHAYEDAMYRRMEGATEGALARIQRLGITPLPVGFIAPPDCLARKRRAVHRYRSQLRGLATPGRLGHEDAFAPERFWRLLV